MMLLKSILSSKWMIDPIAVQRLSPFIMSVISGNVSGIGKPEMSYPYNVTTSNEESGVSESVGIIPIKSVITKYESCEALGLTQLEYYLARFAADQSIIGVVIDMDSPGGEASYLPNFAKTIQNFPKPIITYYSGLCASAGYYIASQTDEIYASVETDEVGSIGTMIWLTGKSDNNPEVDHIIMATKSTEKNLPFLEALKGNYELLQTQGLDPINEKFHQNVLSARPDISQDALKGKLYLTDEAMNKNLIDGQLPNLKAAISRVIELAGIGTRRLNSQNQQMTKYERLSAILGREVTEQTAFTADDLAKIDAETPVVHEAVLDSNSAPEQSNLAELIANAVATGINPVQQSVIALENRIKALEGPGADPVQPTPKPAAETPDYSKTPWLDPENPVNKHINQEKAQLGI